MPSGARPPSPALGNLLIFAGLAVLSGPMAVAAGDLPPHPLGAPTQSEQAATAFAEYVAGAEGDGDDCYMICPGGTAGDVESDAGDDLAALSQHAGLQGGLTGQVLAAAPQDAALAQAVLDGPALGSLTLVPARPTRHDARLQAWVDLEDPNGIGGALLLVNRTRGADSQSSRVPMEPAGGAAWRANVTGPFVDGDRYALRVFVWDDSIVGRTSAEASLDPLRPVLATDLPGTRLTAATLFQIPDTTPPSIHLDPLSRQLDAGGSLALRVRVEDAGKLFDVRVTYGHDGGPNGTALLNPDGDRYAARLPVGLTLRPFRFVVEAMDDVGNLARTAPVSIPVVDRQAPEVRLVEVPARPEASTRGRFAAVASDDLGVHDVTLVLTTPAGSERIGLERAGPIWSALVRLPNATGPLQVHAEATDTSQNRATSEPASVDVQPASEDAFLSRVLRGSLGDAPREAGILAGIAGSAVLAVAAAAGARLLRRRRAGGTSAGRGPTGKRF